VKRTRCDDCSFKKGQQKKSDAMTVLSKSDDSSFKKGQQKKIPSNKG
jgi:hypothetical protein